MANANVTYKDVGVVDWAKLALDELESLNVQGIPSNLAFKHAWEFGKTPKGWALDISDAERKKEARKHSYPAGPASTSGGMVV